MTAILFLIIRILFIIALYSFLGWAVLAIWRDLKQESRALSPSQLPKITIITEDSSQPLSFQQLQISIGRDPSCNVCFNDNTVSAQHARLEFRQSQWWLEDLQSTNGTFVNGVNVTQPIVVTTGDEVSVGHVHFRIEL